jgi:hypothetical protein
MLPRFGTRSATPYRMINGSPSTRGLLFHGRTLTSSSPEVREVLMGFTRGDTAAPGLTLEQRSHLLDQRAHLNILFWTLSVAGKPSCIPRHRAHSFSSPYSREGLATPTTGDNGKSRHIRGKKSTLPGAMEAEIYAGRLGLHIRLTHQGAPPTWSRGSTHSIARDIMHRRCMVR